MAQLKLTETRIEKIYMLGKTKYDLEFTDGKFTSLYIFDHNHEIIGHFHTVAELEMRGKELGEILKVIANQ